MANSQAELLSFCQPALHRQEVYTLHPVVPPLKHTTALTCCNGSLHQSIIILSCNSPEPFLTLGMSSWEPWCTQCFHWDPCQGPTRTKPPGLDRRTEPQTGPSGTGRHCLLAYWNPHWKGKMERRGRGSKMWKNVERKQSRRTFFSISYLNMLQSGPSGVKLFGDTWLSWMSHTAWAPAQRPKAGGGTRRAPSTSTGCSWAQLHSSSDSTSWA